DIYSEANKILPNEIDKKLLEHLKCHREKFKKHFFDTEIEENSLFLDKNQPKPLNLQFNSYDPDKCLIGKYQANFS
ncbi:MAG: hypothetical protein MHPSP_003431, partial [Paramarteilia canceri]